MDPVVQGLTISSWIKQISRIYITIHINCHGADLVFGRGLPHKINNFDETWVENAQPRLLIYMKLRITI